MSTGGVKRKLTAILSADVKGYRRLMGEDEEATVRTLTAYREVMASLIQQVLKAKKAELPENRRMDFRIGVNLGDVIEEGERIYGDGVNIAACVEGMAEGETSAVAVVAILVVGAGAVVVWSFYLHPAPPPAEVISELTPAGNKRLVPR
jgi:class 3 adenylate cyclase